MSKWRMKMAASKHKSSRPKEEVIKWVEKIGPDKGRVHFFMGLTLPLFPEDDDGK